MKHLMNIRLKLVCILLSCMLGFTIVQDCIALCVTPTEEGNWKNTDPNTRGITRIKIRFVCQDQVHNGELYPPGPPFYIHLYGSCHPSDCDWGEVGAVRSSGFIYGKYDQGYAKRYVYAKMSAYRRGQLWVWIYTDFKDPGRKDYAMNNWFKK